MRLLLLLASLPLAAQNPSTREMNDINWMEFKEVVPAKINTVLLLTGTMEPHGVVNNGADNTAPVAIARKIARDVNALIAPITRTVRGWPFEVVIGPGLRVSGAVLCDQLRSVDFEARHARFLDRAPTALVDDVLQRVGAILEP